MMLARGRKGEELGGGRGQQRRGAPVRMRRGSAEASSTASLYDDDDDEEESGWTAYLENTQCSSGSCSRRQGDDHDHAVRAGRTMRQHKKLGPSRRPKKRIAGFASDSTSSSNWSNASSCSHESSLSCSSTASDASSGPPAPHPYTEEEPLISNSGFAHHLYTLITTAGHSRDSECGYNCPRLLGVKVPPPAAPSPLLTHALLLVAPPRSPPQHDPAVLQRLKALQALIPCLHHQQARGEEPNEEEMLEAAAHYVRQLERRVEHLRDILSQNAY